MKILNIEDDSFKHNNIRKVLSGCGISEVDWVTTLKQGWRKISKAKDNGCPYDLIITDMYYPEEIGGVEEASGEKFIKEAAAKGMTIPIILCSSMNLKYPEIYGCVYYNKARNWEDEMKMLVRRLQ